MNGENSFTPQVLLFCVVVDTDFHFCILAVLHSMLVVEKKDINAFDVSVGIRRRRGGCIAGCHCMHDLQL